MNDLAINLDEPKKSRGRPAKAKDETNEGSAQHILRKQEAELYHKNKDNKAKVIREYYVLNRGKVVKKIEMENGNCYSLYMGTEKQCKDLLLKHG